ncbi:MAG TPA: hypothetical protein VFI56_22020 [Vicinamibacterales bacterium]|nr:hypothetical protein [Vicinamibacterales bacterium]
MLPLDPLPRPVRLLGTLMLANQDWIGMPVAFGFWRPICRDEWPSLIALAAH